MVSSNRRKVALLLWPLFCMPTASPSNIVCSPSTTHTLLVGGSPRRQFVTLESALDAARALPYPRNVTISIAGTLWMDRPIVLGAADSCLVIVGERQIDSNMDHIRFDTVVPYSALEHVSTSDTRIAPSVRGNIYRFNLSTLNATQHAAPWPDTWTQGDPTTRRIGIYLDGKRLEYARFPKANQNATSLCPGVGPNGCENKRKNCVGGIAMKSALAGTSKEWLKGDHTTLPVFQLYPESISKFKQWMSAVQRKALFLVGNWRVDFVFSGARVKALHLANSTNATVDLAVPVSNGIGWKYVNRNSGCGCEPFFAINAIELIEEPLEYALDFEEQAVYVYLPPTNDSHRGVLSVTNFAEPIVTITRGAQDITLANVHLGYSFSDGIKIEDGARNIKILGGSIHDVGGDGIYISATGSLLRSSNIYNTGGGGVVVAANDNNAWKELRSSKIEISNNHIYQIGFLGIAYGVGISVVNGSTGVLVTHNLIHHVAGKGVHGGHKTSSGHAATYVNQGQFNNVFSYNEVFACVLFQALNSLFPKASEETLDSLTKKGGAMIDKSEFMDMYNSLLQQQQQQSGDICKTSNPCGDGESCRPCRNTKGYCCDAQALPVQRACAPGSKNQCPEGYSCLPVSQHLVTEEPFHADGHLIQPPQIYDGLMPPVAPVATAKHYSRTGYASRKLRTGYGASSYKCQIRPVTCELCVKSKGNYWFGSHCIVSGEPMVMDAPMTSTVKQCRKNTAMDNARCSQYKNCDVCTSQAKDKTYGQLCAWAPGSGGNYGTCIQNQVSFWRRPIITDSSKCDGIIQVSDDVPE